MYLERIEIQGFKSFANKTILEFPAVSHKDSKSRSKTAIVGPNGSGKSNISDAVRWVLGEQSIKMLRGKKTEDVIFAGSEQKARLGFAEVSLYLNNEDKTAPIDYSEIVITRRVYRDGEGEYLINKSKVRLYDILMLLAKANFGQKSYSIIGQGMVDHIINISPWERKEFFDEATGVKQYQIKRDQSINRLNRAKENLEQTNNIVTELEPRLRLLTRQIKKLEKRKEVEQSLRQLQEKYYASIWKGLKKNHDEFDERFSIKDALKQELDSKLAILQTKLAEIARSESRKDIFNNLQKDYSKLQTEKNDWLKDLATVKGKMSVEYVKIGKQNLSWLEDKKEEIENRIKEIQESLNNIKNKLEHKREKLSEKEEKEKDVLDELIVLENNLKSVESALVQIKSGSTNYFYDSVRAIIRQKETIEGIYGTVGDLAKLDSMYEVALSVAAGHRTTAVVVSDDEVAVKCINYLKENKLAPVTFFPLNKIKSQSIRENNRAILAENGVIGFAIDLISFDSKFRKVYEQIFGSTIVVDKVEHAREVGIGRERMVTLGGDIFEKSGMIRGGFRVSGKSSWFMTENNGKIVSQEEKLKEIAILKSKIEDLTKEKVDLLTETNNLRVELQVDDTKQKALRNDLEDLIKERDNLGREISDNEIDPKDKDRLVTQLQARRREIENKVNAVEEIIVGVRSKIDKFNLDEEKKKEEVFRLQDEMQSAQSKLNEISREVNEIKIELAKLDTREEDLVKEVLHELGENKKIEELKIEGEVNSDQLWFDINKLKQSLEMIGGIDPEVVDEHKEVSGRYEFLSKQTDDLEKAIRNLGKIVEELDAVIGKQFNASFNKINKSFEQYFKKIFQGGKAKLTLLQKEKIGKDDEEQTEAEQALIEGQENEAEETVKKEKAIFTQTGIDLYVSPPNKKLNTISALSGGERTMTSLALLCAIIDSNPAPFVVMDEVDAALDEANSERFAAIIEEIAYKTQFVFITHNRIIMHVADVLYGVAMGEDGVSKTLSLDMKDAEKQARE